MNESQPKSKPMLPKIQGVTINPEPDEPQAIPPAAAAAEPTATSNTADTNDEKGTTHLSAPALMQKVEKQIGDAFADSEIEITPAFKGYVRGILAGELKKRINQAFVLGANIQWHRAQWAAAKKLRAKDNKPATK